MKRRRDVRVFKARYTDRDGRTRESVKWYTEIPAPDGIRHRIPGFRDSGATLELGPSGTHVMLVGLTKALHGYQYFPMRLTFARAGKVNIDVYVEEAK